MNPGTDDDASRFQDQDQPTAAEFLENFSSSTSDVHQVEEDV